MLALTDKVKVHDVEVCQGNDEARHEEENEECKEM